MYQPFVVGILMHCPESRVPILRGIKDSLWSLPGGKSEPDETKFQTIEREVREETKYLYSLHAIENFPPRYIGHSANSNLPVYITSCYAVSFIPKLNPNEHDSYAFVTYDALAQLHKAKLCVPLMSEVLEYWRANV